MHFAYLNKFMTMMNDDDDPNKFMPNQISFTSDDYLHISRGTSLLLKSCSFI